MRFIAFFIFYYLFLFYYGIHLTFSLVEWSAIEKSFYLKKILDFSFALFGKNDFALRIPSILMSIFSLMLFYSISKNYFKVKELNYVVIIFAFLPGFLISSLLVNKSIYLIFLTLLFIYFYFNKRIVSYFLLLGYAFLDNAFFSLYIGLFIFSIYKKDNFLLLFSLVLLALNANYFNYDIGGKPKSYFLDVIAVYSMIFSPLIFIYFVYALFRSKKDLIYFLTIGSFLLSIILSFRQRIRIDDYAPFALIFLIHLVKTFLISYKVRLPQFRNEYKKFGLILGISLILFDILVFNANRFFFVDKTLYLKPVITYLQKKDIKKIEVSNKFEPIFQFYGFKTGGSYKIKIYKNIVSIIHKNRVIKQIDVSKINIL